MITSFELNLLIQAIDNRLQNYSVSFLRCTQPIDLKTSNQSELLNERTLSNFINIEIYKLLSKKYSIELFVNEYEVLFKNGITTSSFNSLIYDVGGKINSKRKKHGMWDFCSVDGLFLINNILMDDVSTYVYVEYKLNIYLS